MYNAFWENALNDRFVRIEPDDFKMGSDPGHEGVFAAWAEVEPPSPTVLKRERFHSVAIKRPFYIDRFPTTVADFDRFASFYEYDKLEAECNRNKYDRKVWVWERFPDFRKRNDADDNYDENSSSQINGGGWYGWARRDRDWRCFYWDFEYVDKETKEWRETRYWQGFDNPVVGLNRKEVYAYVNWLNTDRIRKAYKDTLNLNFTPKFRLPTEAEFEYCLKAGSQCVFSWGDDPQDVETHAKVADRAAEQKFVNEPIWKRSFNVFSSFRDIMFPNARAFMATAPVGSYKPNKFGLYDMMGNVLEMTSDVYKEDYGLGKEWDRDSVVVDPGRINGDKLDDYYASKDDEHFDQSFVCKGGAWCGGPDVCRPAARIPRTGWFRSDYLGFRVCFDAKD
ncbi:MAG: formylglycine-generating enzyme family protein [Thermoguttaceae bacterium]|nr:formylglycine-generating enzyme family protein [Thermoguttaceae bacterium]